MTRGESSKKKRKCKIKHCSAMFNAAWCDFSSKGDILKLHNMCPNPKLERQNQITFTPRQFQMEGAGFKNKVEKIFKETKSARIKVLKHGANVAAPLIRMDFAGKSIKPQIGQATTTIFKSTSGGDVLSLTDIFFTGCV